MNHHRALQVFAESLARRPGLDETAIEELCRAHPDLDATLRLLARERAKVGISPPRVPSTDGRKLGRTVEAATRYVALREISRGGMGVVLHVWDTVLERPVAMKILDLEALPADAGAADEALARFLGEARIAGQLQHPGVVPVHELGADEEGRVYFTMPFFEGRTLGEVFDRAASRSEGWSLGRALLALSRVCDVVAYAHSRGVVHRDLKPTNVIAGAFGEIVVVDWGLAKVLDSPEPVARDAAGGVEAADAEVGRTLDGTVAGTPPYMAPEQAEGRVAEVSYGADVYALGAMLYRLLAGRAPYAPRRGRDDPAKTLELIRRGPPTPLRRIAPDAPEGLAAISERAMARRPEDRYPRVEEMARDLNEFLEGRVGGASRR